MKSGWIEGDKSKNGAILFDTEASKALAHKIKQEFVTLEQACRLTRQSKQSFRRTWIISGYIEEIRLGSKKLVRKPDIDKVQSIWAEHATSTYIAASLGRERYLCVNLEKMGVLEPSFTLGSGSRKIKLYPRQLPSYQKSKIA